MKITTRQKTEIEVDEKNILTFPEGVVGFEEYQTYALIEVEDEEPFVRLQCSNIPEVAFVLIDPLLFYPEYDFEVEDNIVELLSIEKVEDIQLYTIVTVYSDHTKMTANMLAPILVNKTNRKSCQLILRGTDYLTRHPIFGNPENEG